MRQIGHFRHLNVQIGPYQGIRGRMRNITPLLTPGEREERLVEGKLSKEKQRLSKVCCRRTDFP